jgi:hypothetical protein
MTVSRESSEKKGGAFFTEDGGWLSLVPYTAIKKWTKLLPLYKRYTDVCSYKCYILDDDMPVGSCSHRIFATSASMASGVVVDAHLCTTFPSLSTRNFSKFHYKSLSVKVTKNE